MFSRTVAAILREGRSFCSRHTPLPSASFADDSSRSLPHILLQQIFDPDSIHCLIDYADQVIDWNELFITGWQERHLIHHIWLEHRSWNFAFFHTPIESCHFKKVKGCPALFGQPLFCIVMLFCKQKIFLFDNLPSHSVSRRDYSEPIFKFDQD